MNTLKRNKPDNKDKRTKQCVNSKLLTTSSYYLKRKGTILKYVFLTYTLETVTDSPNVTEYNDLFQNSVWLIKKN